MNNTYTSLVNQTFHFPQEGFEVDDNGYLEFNGVDLKAIIEKHGTPLKLTYLPKIGMQIKKAKQMFALSSLCNYLLQTMYSISLCFRK